MGNDELFAKLTERIGEILRKLDGPVRSPIRQYCRTRDELMICDVSVNKDYRGNFAQFYRLGRRKQEWKNDFFALLEQSKHDSSVNFANTLERLKQLTGRVEPSFSSKLVATINPHQPVIDSVVTGVLGYKQPYYYQNNRCEKLNDLYQSLADRLNLMIQDDRFNHLSQRFLSVYPNYSFTDIKILDFMLWQLRELKTTKR